MVSGRHRLLVAIAVLVVGSTATACGGGGTQAGERAGDRLRIGYFPNVTHAPAIIGLRASLFAEHLGPDVEIETKTFNAGGQAVEALFGDAIDLTYIGPNPAINAWAQSQGKAVRLIAGSTSGGAALVVHPGISSAQDLRGKKLSSPALGNTQDVALRAWLKDQGLVTDQQGGGDVSIQPQENAQILETFRSGDIDGAWVPEPWATRLVTEGEGTVLVDERDLWPGGRFVTTHVLVRTAFLKDHPDIVKRFLEGHVAAVDAAARDTERSQRLVVEGISEITGVEVNPDTISAAWSNLEFTVDPVASSLRSSAEHAVAVGQLEEVDLDGIYDLRPLNEVLDDLGRDEVKE